MIYAYARVSTNEKLGLQDIGRQYRELEKMGVRFIFHQISSCHITVEIASRAYQTWQ